MTKKLDMKIVILLLLLMFSLAGCNVANGSEEISDAVIESPEVEIAKTPSSASNREVTTKVKYEPEAEVESEPEEKFVFTKLFVYFFPNGKDFILIPDSWEDAYGVIEGTDSILFLHNNTEDFYAPLMEVKMYKSEEAWLSAMEKGANDEDGVYTELGQSDGIIYGAKVFTTNYYQLGDNPNGELAQAFDTVFVDFYYSLNTFNLREIDSDIRNKKSSLIDGSAFNLKMVAKSEGQEDKEPIAILSTLEETKNGAYIRKYGYINKYGEFVIPSIYDEATPFKDGVAIVRKGNYYGLINKEGKTVLDIKYDYLKEYSEGYLVYSEYGTGKEGYIDVNGNILLPAQFSQAFAFSGGKALVSDSNGLYGYIDTQGQTVIPIQYKSAKSYSDGLALVNAYGKNFFIDSDGDTVIEIDKFKNDPENFVATDFINGVAFKKIFPYNADIWASHAFESNKNRIEWSMIDKNGREITRAFNDINHTVIGENEFTDQLLSVKKDGEWVLINTAGNVVLEPQYDYIRTNQNTYTVIKNDREGILDQELNIVFPPIFDKIDKFNNGYANAWFNGLKLIISESGDIICYQVSESDELLSNIIKIPFEIESLYGADICKLFNYELKDLEQAFEGQFFAGPSGPDGSYTGLFFEAEELEMVFDDESRPSYIGLGSYKSIKKGTKLDKVVDTLGEPKFHPSSDEAKTGEEGIKECELIYNLDGHCLNFFSTDGETVSDIIIFDLEESTNYFKYIENKIDKDKTIDLDYTLIKEDKEIDLSSYESDFIIAKYLEDKLTVYFDLEFLVQLIGGQYSVNDKTGKVRIDYSDTTFYYSNEFWQNKNGNYLRDGDGTILENSRYYMAGDYLYDFFEYRVLWQRDTNEIIINPKTNSNGHYPMTEIPANKMVVYVRQGSSWLDSYAETFMVDSVSEIYERYPNVIPKEPNTEGDFGMEIYHHYVAEEAADYMVVSDGYDRNYSLFYNDNGYEYKYDDSLRLSEGKNILEHHFRSYFPKTLDLKKCPPFISEEALIIQLKDEISPTPKVVYVIDTVNDDGDKCVLNIRPSDEPIVLCLASFSSIKWSINNPDNVEIQAILYSQGYKLNKRAIVKGDIDDIPIYYTDSLIAAREMIVGNQPVPDNYKYEQGDIERRMVDLDQHVQKIFSVRPYSLTYMNRDKESDTDQTIMDERYYEFFDPIVERVLGTEQSQAE